MVKHVIGATITLFGIASFFAYLQFSAPGLIGIDGYFHIRLAQEIWQNGPVYDFRWLVYTIYNPHFADDHFLFHLIQIPFTFGNLITGAKIYGIVFPTLVFVLFWGILTHQKIQFPLFWTTLLFVSSAPFLMRMGMPRAASLSLIFLLLGTWCVLAQHPKRLLPLGFCFVWLYGGFPLLGVLAFVFWVTHYVVTQKKDPQIFIYCGLGLLLGLCINPYFPHNIAFLFKSYTQIELGMFPAHIPGGTEDYPYASSTAVRNALPVWIAVFLGLVPYLVSKKKMDANTLFLFLFSTALLCLYLNARRFLEYWVPFGILFSAFAINPLIVAQPTALLKNTRNKLIVGFMGLCLLFAGRDTLVQTAFYRTQNLNPKIYQGAAQFLKNETPDNAIVFTADWDDFPLLFHHNTHNRYIVGMDLRYLFYFDPAKCLLWLSITEGKEPNAIVKIKEQFQAQYIFSLKDETLFLNNLSLSLGDKQVVYEDDFAIVFKI